MNVLGLGLTLSTSSNTCVTTLSKNEYTLLIQNAYTDWILFMDEMSHTNIECIPSQVDWKQLGHNSFPWAKYASTIQKTRFQCQMTLQIHNRHVYCIRSLLLIDYLQHYVNANPTSTDPYVIAYQYLPFSKLNLTELQTMSRLNYIVSNGDKFELAVSIHQSKNWGFNTFAIKSYLNDNVLTKIRAFVGMTPFSLKRKYDGY